MPDRCLEYSCVYETGIRTIGLGSWAVQGDCCGDETGGNRVQYELYKMGFRFVSRPLSFVSVIHSVPNRRPFLQTKHWLQKRKARNILLQGFPTGDIRIAIWSTLWVCDAREFIFLFLRTSKNTFLDLKQTTNLGWNFGEKFLVNIPCNNSVVFTWRIFFFLNSLLAIRIT
jgi:hypothetical protein